MTPFVFNTTPSIVFGTGSALRLGALVKPRFGKRVLVVTDAGIIKAGLLEGALESLTAADIGWSIYSAVTADPPEALVLDALKQAQRI